MQMQVYVPMWLSLPQTVRLKIAKIFSLPQSGWRSIEYAATPIVTSDGFTNNDLAEITSDKLQAYLKTEETDLMKLFWQLTAQIEGEIALEAEKEVAKLMAEQEVLDDKNREQTLETLKKVGEMAEEVLQPKRRGRPPKKV